MTARAISDPQSLPSLLPSSLSRRRMVTPSGARLLSIKLAHNQEPIPPPPYLRHHRQISRMLEYSPSLTFDGGITMFIFILVMSGKLPSKPIVACLNTRHVLRSYEFTGHIPSDAWMNYSRISSSLVTVFIYMDDILIATRTMEEHCRIICQVLQILNQINSFSNWRMWVREGWSWVPWHPSSSWSTRYGPHQLWGIADWPTPAKLKDIRTFLGFTGFYHRSFAIPRLARPLNDLTRKTSPWQWENQNKTPLIG